MFIASLISLLSTSFANLECLSIQLTVLVNDFDIFAIYMLAMNFAFMPRWHKKSWLWCNEYMVNLYVEDMVETLEVNVLDTSKFSK